MGKDKKRWYEHFGKLPSIKLPKLRLDNAEKLSQLEIENARSTDDNGSSYLKEHGHYPSYQFESIKDVYLHSMDAYGERVFILAKDKPRDKSFIEYSYRRFGSDAESLGTAITKIYGRSPEENRIVIIGENQYDWYVAYMAALLGAGIAVPVDKELPESELEQTILRARANIVVYSTGLHIKDKLKALENSLNCVDYFMEMKSDAPLSGKTLGVQTAIREGRRLILSGDRSFMELPHDPDAFRALFFTSGTTAKSKGVMVSSRQLAANINAVSAYVRIYKEDRLFSVLPLHHTYESSIGFLVPFGNGSSIAVNSGLKHIGEELQSSHPTILIAVPLLLEALHNNIMKNIRRSGKQDVVNAIMHITNGLKGLGIDVKRSVFKEIFAGLGGELRLIVSAAAPIDRSIGKWYTSLGIMFLQGYGLTETCPISAVTTDFDPRLGSVGRVIQGAQIRVSNPDENGSGELLISAPTLMMGYYEDEEATADVIETDADGRRWFHSGDLGYVDRDDYVYITGRIKNVIVTQNGKNIYPEELELLLAEIPEIAECMVYGKQAEGNELIVTCRALPDYEFIKEQHGDLSTKEVYDLIFSKIKDVNRRLTNYKNIKRLEIKDGEFIKTSTKKIKRFKEIREGKVLEIK